MIKPRLMKGFLTFGCVVALFASLCETIFAQTGEIKIGGLTPLTGQFSSYGADIERGIRLGVAKINDDGGVLGKKLVVDIQDTATNSAQTVSLIRRFSSSPDIVAIVGPPSTPDLLALLPVSRQLDIPIISIGSQKPISHDEFPPTVFRVSFVVTPEAIGSVIKKVAAAKGIKRIGLFVDRANDSSQAEATSVREAMKSIADVKLIADESYAAGDKNFAVQISKMLQIDVDTMWLSGNTNEDAIIINQARARGFKGLILGGAPLTDPKILDLAGNVAPPFVMFTPVNLSSDRPVVREFMASFQKTYSNAKAGAQGANSYDAVLLVADAIRRAGSTDRKAITQALGSTSNLLGVGGNYSYNGQGDNVAPEPYILELGSDGTFVSMK